MLKRIFKILISSMKIIDRKSIGNLKLFLSIVWHHYRKQWEIAVSLMLVVSLLKLPMPLLTKYLVDEIILRGDLNALWFICLVLLLATILYLIIEYIKSLLLFKVSTALTIRYNTTILKHLQQVPNQYLHSKESGYLMARVMKDPNELSGIFINTSMTIIQSFLVLTVSSIVIFYINWKLALVSFVLLPFYILSHLLFVNKVKYWNEKAKEQQANIYKTLKESIQSIPFYKLFSLEISELLHFHKDLKERYHFSKSQYKYELYSQLIVSFFSALLPITILLFGTYEIINKNFTIGGLIAFNTLLGYIFNPVRSLINVHLSFQTSIVSLNRIYEILNVKKTEEPASYKKSNVPTNYSIEFKHVSFTYNDSQEVIQDLNLCIPENRKVVFSGPIGSGKTTIINLLTKSMKPSKGIITLGGIDISKIDKRTFYSFVGIVTQNTFLLSRSIYENIKLGNLHASDEDVVKCAKLALIHDFIKQLPDGYNTQVGEDGEYLSGGQKQLIALARVLLRHPKILILDEPTASVDVDTELKIKESIHIYSKNHTVILISHKAALIEDYDLMVNVCDYNAKNMRGIKSIVSN